MFHPLGHLGALLRGQVAGGVAEQVVIQFEVLQQHLGVEQVFLVHVHVGHLVRVASVIGEVVLDRVDLVVDEVLFAFNVTGEAAHTVIHGHDVRIELVNQEVERFKR
ncbi:hypothetical protein D3C85_1001110 [compost metagenome]